MKPKEINKVPLTRENKYSVSPYNFVSFPAYSVSRYNNPEELPAHNNYKDGNRELLSGYIEYTLRAETPIIVADGKEDRIARFFKNEDGKYAIPANTIRGLMRTTVQILSFSDIVGKRNSNNKYINSYIYNRRLLYRDIAGGNSLSKIYKNILGISTNRRIGKNVKAGYIYKKGGKYYIQPALELKKGIPYFRVDELELRKIGGENIEGIDFLYKRELLDKEQDLKEKNRIAHNPLNSKRDKNIAKKERYRILKELKREGHYKPYQVKISFDLDNEGRVTKVGDVGQCHYEGYILSGGFILGKRSHYIVPAEDDSQGRIDLSEEDILAYEDDLLATKKMENKEGKLKAKKEENEFYALPKENECKPVFYIDKNGTHFGFTPYLRLSYNHSILDGVSDRYKGNSGISYADGIFGFSNREFNIGKEEKEISYKSRVSFQDAVVVGEGEVDDESIMEIVLGEPKPNSYNLYLLQKGLDKKHLITYEDEEFNLRGYKQYWLKEYVEKLSLGENEAKNMRIKIYPLKESTEFKGRIYFNNLHEDELGLLGWALKLNGNSYHNIGLAKPFGFGRVKVKDVKLKIEDLNTKYTTFSFDYYKDDDIDKYIEFYKDYFSKKYLKGENIEKTTSIKEFLYIKSNVIKEKDANNYRYMDFNEFRFKKVLPTILECKKAYLKEKNNNKVGKKGSSYQKNRHSGKRNNKNKRNTNNFGNSMMEAFIKAKKKDK